MCICVVQLVLLPSVVEEDCVNTNAMTTQTVTEVAGVVLMDVVLSVPSRFPQVRHPHITIYQIMRIIACPQYHKSVPNPQKY